MKTQKDLIFYFTILLLGILFLVAFIPQVSATHTSSVIVSPEEIAPNSNYEFTVKVTNTGQDSIKKVIIYHPLSWEDLVCKSPPTGWTVKKGSDYCVYETDSNFIVSSQSEVFTLSLKTSRFLSQPSSDLAWVIYTRDINNDGFDLSVYSKSSTTSASTQQTNLISLDVSPNGLSTNTGYKFAVKVTNKGLNSIKRIVIFHPEDWKGKFVGPYIGWRLRQTGNRYQYDNNILKQGQSVTFTPTKITPQAFSKDSETKWVLIVEDINGKLFSTTFYSVGESEINQPPEPTPSGFSVWVNKILDWLKNLFKSIFGIQSIVGSKVVEPNTQETYQIDLSAPIPDSDWSDGSYEVQYANWVLLDKDGNIKQEGTWEKVSGKYTKSVTITTPANIGNFALVGVITQYDLTYDFPNKKWTTSEETIINKEAIDLETKYSVVEPEVPIPSGFSKFLTAIGTWLKSVWDWITWWN